MRLSDKAYELIRHQIVTLQLPPLAPIDEQALMLELKLGRTPIREALQRLAAEDLVLLAPRRGMFVADISVTDLQKIFEARLVLEGFCARLAAERASRAQLDEIHRVIERLELVQDGDSRELMDIDEEFHELLYQVADNEFISETLRRLHALSFRLWHLVLDRLGDVRGALEQHREIYHALEAHDAARAEEVLQAHITEFQNQIKAVL